MPAIRRPPMPVLIGAAFVLTALGYLVFAGPLGYRAEPAAVTMLVALGAAMGLMAYVLTAGSGD